MAAVIGNYLSHYCFIFDTINSYWKLFITLLFHLDFELDINHIIVLSI